MKVRRDITYGNYSRMIYKLAWNWHLKTGAELDDLISDGNLVFSRVITAHINCKSEFSTHLYSSITNFYLAKFRDCVRTKKRVADQHERDYINLRSIPESEYLSPERAAELSEMIGRLGKDARAVVNCVLDAPRDLMWSVSRKNIKMINRHTLHQYLVKRQGWTHGQCVRAFEEITAALETL